MDNILMVSQTDRLKGLLILLIIMGHIEEFFTEHELLQMVLYSFHVSSFLMLPFLFNKDLLNYKNLKKNLKRIYVPYSLFFLFSIVAYSFLTKELDVFSAILAWFIGTAEVIKPQAGFSLLWFFPALFSMLFILMLYNRLSLINQKRLLFFLLLTHLTLSLLPHRYLSYFLFSLYVPLYLFIIGMVIRYIYTNIDYHKYSIWLLSMVFGILLYLAYGSNFNLSTPLFPNIVENPLMFLIHDLILIVGFFTMIAWSRKIKFFEMFGTYSLAIFTLHPFVIQLLNRVYPWSSMFDGVVKFILVVIVSLLLTKGIYYFRLNRILYPR